MKTFKRQNQLYVLSISLLLGFALESILITMRRAHIDVSTSTTHRFVMGAVALWLIAMAIFFIGDYLEFRDSNNKTTHVG